MHEYKQFAPLAVPDNGSSGRRVGIAGAFTGIAVMGMLMSGANAETAITMGAKLFGAAYLAEVVSHSPLLITWVLAWMDRAGKRDEYRMRAPAQVLQPYSLPAEPMQPPALSGNFVPAIKPPDAQTLRDAKTWLLELWSTNTQLNPERVLPDTSKSPGKLQWALPGNRGAVDYMQEIGLIERERYAYRYVGPSTLPEAMDILNAGGYIPGG